MKPGRVILMGAGPGDLDLLTRKAVRALLAADVLLLDELVCADLVELAPRARVMRVGKRGGCRSTPQDFIQRLMRRYALQGKTVVRVKGGEALLFGRAGEEIAFLEAAGIEVELVNGISAGLAAATSLGISLTHRGHCDGVSFVTAHTHDGTGPDWAALAKSRTTLVIYMGMQRIEAVCAALLAHLPGGTPAAVVQWASTPREARLVTRLDTLAGAAREAGMASPAVILVGDAIGQARRRSTAGAEPAQRVLGAA
ncbi:Uroporphyrinogen-III C-methyltransferase [Pigmentiphaga humi]|uniref:uroporphyrinogen-III C-methyltransferase n=1 Tax=Pigmentiphaga humi TaxID=2478468 RepID=A0A3P4B637_9BURK|nr:uroporphyrinogen-III C-methyltransferase [Pigmentiphaga humi]VCU71128.1 Uroporphyrinogen-III C-methyltransferase [Pigmentiphaga humi]